MKKYRVKENPIFQFPVTEKAYREQKEKQKITDFKIENVRIGLFAIISITLISAFVACLFGKYEKASEIIIAISFGLFIIATVFARYFFNNTTYYLYVKAFDNRIEIEQVIYKATYVQKAVIYYDDVIKASLCSKGKKFKIIFNNDSESYITNYDKKGNVIPIVAYSSNNIIFKVPKRSQLQGFLIYDAPKYFNMKDRSRKFKYRNVTRFYSRIED